MQREFYSSLEILRGLCAAEVFVWHICAHINPDFFAATGVETLIFFLWRLSEAAVLTFMVISGFVVSNSFRHYRAADGDHRAIGLFLSARALRIWSLSIPVALVSFALTMGVRYGFDDWRPWGRFTDTDLLVWSALAFNSEWNGPGWTLLYELLAYAMLPFAVLVFTATWRLRAISILTMAVVLWFFSDVVGMSYRKPHVWGMVGAFAIGAAYYPLRRFRPSPAVGMVLASAGLMALLWLGSIQIVPFDNIVPKLAACAALFVGVFSVDFGKGRSARWLLTLGAMSYSLYLWHWPIIYFGNFYMGYLLFGYGSAEAWNWQLAFFELFVSVPLTIVVAWYSYKHIERRAKLSFILKRNRPVQAETLVKG